MATIAIKRGTQAQITATSVVDGQILYTTDLGVDNKVYLDVGTSRVQVSGRSQASEISYNNTTGGGTATTVQGAIADINSNLENCYKSRGYLPSEGIPLTYVLPLGYYITGHNTPNAPTTLDGIFIELGRIRIFMLSDGQMWVSMMWGSGYESWFKLRG